MNLQESKRRAIDLSIFVEDEESIPEQYKIQLLNTIGFMYRVNCLYKEVELAEVRSPISRLNEDIVIGSNGEVTLLEHHLSDDDKHDTPFFAKVMQRIRDEIACKPEPRGRSMSVKIPILADDDGTVQRAIDFLNGYVRDGAVYNISFVYERPDKLLVKAEVDSRFSI